MAHQISGIRRKITLLVCSATVIAVAVLLFVTPMVSDVAPQAIRSGRLNYLIFGPLLLGGIIIAIQIYLRPISDLGYALEIGSTPATELTQTARQIALNAPIYFFLFPTGGAFLVALLSDIFGALLWPDYVFLSHFLSTLLITVTAACISLVVSLICRQWMRPVLLYTSLQSQTGGYRLNIRTRLFAAVLVLALMALLFTGIFGYKEVVSVYRERLADTTLLHLETAMASTPSELGQEHVLDAFIEKLSEDVQYDMAFLMDDEGQILDQRPPTDVGFTLKSELWLKERPSKFRQAKGYFALIQVPSSQPRQWMGVGYIVHPFRSNQVVRTMIAMIVSGMILLVLAAVVSHYLAADVVIDMRDVTMRLLDIAHEEKVDLSSPLPMLSLDEVGDLILAYNALQQRIQMQQEQIEYKQRQLIALQSLSYKIGTIQDVEHLLREVVRDVERTFGYHNAAILLTDERTDELFVAATDHVDSAWRDQRFRIGQDGIVGYVAATGMPLLINDVSDCDFYIPDHASTHSKLAVPLIVGDKVIGVFSVSSERIAAFEESDMRILTALGNQVAIAIENARLFSEVVTNANELERRARNLTILHEVSTTLSASLRIEDVLMTTTEKLVSLFQVSHGAAILFDEEDEHGKVAVEYPDLGFIKDRVQLGSLPSARRVLATRETLFIADAQRSDLMKPIQETLRALNIHSTLLVPLMTKGDIVGIVHLDSIGDRRSFTPEEVSICQTIAAQTAIAVENVRLFANLRLQADMLSRMARNVTAERSQLDAILRNQADGLLVTDLMGRIVLFNPAFLSLFNLSEDGLNGQFVTKMVPQVPLQHLIVQTSSEGTVHAQEMALPDGRFLQATAAGVREGEQVSSVVIVLRDVTRERQLDAMKSDFISTVSHELRTPLTPVLGFAKLIRKSLDKNVIPAIPADHRDGHRAAQRIDQNLDILVSMVERLSDLVEDVLFLADLDAGRLQWRMDNVDLAGLLEDIVNTYRPEAEAKNLTMHIEWPDNLPHIYGDAERLTRAISNLISNAIKFTDVGQVRVHGQAIYWQNERWRPQPIVDVPEALSERGYVLIAVRDTGPGISPKAQQPLFERFGQGARDMLTEKPAGTGLGLALSKEIIAYHGGHVWVESELEQGSTFFFVLPLSLGEGSLSPWEDGVVLPENAPTILVVDDEPSMRELLHYVLFRAGYRTVMAADGPTALNMARTHKPDLIVLDIMIPGISGLDVTSVLKADEVTQDIPIVILSVLLGADACFAKPLDQDPFLDTLDKLLAEQQS
jgi:PAS domain S-box-containing protein